MLIHIKDPSFLDKKDFYKNIVENFDNKNNMYLFDIYKRNNSTIFSTKEESQKSSPCAPLLKYDENNIKELTLNTDKVFNSSSEFNEKETKLWEKQSDLDENESEEIPKNDFCNDELFNKMCNIIKNENNSLKFKKENIYGNGNNNYESEKEKDNLDNNNIFLRLKNENYSIIFPLEDIL